MKTKKTLALLTLLATGAASAQTPATRDAQGGMDRTHRSVEGYSRESGERGSATSGQLKEQSTLATDVVSKPRSVTATLTSGNAWIFDADAALYDDLDGDGYFRYLSVRFDADTYLPDMYVNADLYLSEDGQTWEHYFTTEDFLIGGTVPDDEYFVETELLQGYPPGLYDVLIELYDADFGTFEDEFGPAQTSALSLLPIEDATFDPVPIAISTGSGGGGSASWIGLALLPLAAAIARRRGRRRGAAGRTSRR